MPLLSPLSSLPSLPLSPPSLPYPLYFYMGNFTSLLLPAVKETDADVTLISCVDSKYLLSPPFTLYFTFHFCSSLLFSLSSFLLSLASPLPSSLSPSPLSPLPFSPSFLDSMLTFYYRISTDCQNEDHSGT